MQAAAHTTTTTTAHAGTQQASGAQGRTRAGGTQGQYLRYASQTHMPAGRTCAAAEGRGVWPSAAPRRPPAPRL